MSLFSSKSSSTATSNTYDQKIGVESGGTVNRVDTSGNVTISSDEVANNAIETTKNALDTSVTFLGDTFTKVLSMADTRIASAENNVAASHQLASEAISKSQENIGDQVLKLALYAGVAAVAIVAFKNKWGK